MGWIFVIAIGITVTLLGARRWQARRLRAALRAQPGRNPDAPLRVDRFDAIDTTVLAARCSCGGRMSVLSEGSVSVGGEAARVVHAECVVCEEGHDFFFDLTAVTH